MLANILTGLTVSLNPINAFLSVLGVVLGVIIGAIPGLGPGMAIAVTVPITFGMAPEAGMLLLMGIFCGSVYGGSITAILMGVPGTPASIATVWDGHKMAQKGQADKALNTAIVA
ncbi:MAG: tripartite tricarboxylate transporter permease, partial [Desulfobacterales bacterium]|nr:tripartite tricarboxylate transporter permease [Desulfobacterales bacterium]